jgi:hypothetical protein
MRLGGLQHQSEHGGEEKKILSTTMDKIPVIQPVA